MRYDCTRNAQVIADHLLSVLYVLDRMDTRSRKKVAILIAHSRAITLQDIIDLDILLNHARSIYSPGEPKKKGRASCLKTSPQ